MIQINHIEENVLNIYEENPFINRVSNITSVPVWKVKKILDKHGVKTLTSQEATALKNKIDRDKYRTHSVDKNFFKELNEENAYIIGFLITDGSVTGNRVKLVLKREDRYVLEYMKDKFKYTGEIHDIESKCNGKSYKSSKLDITCYEWIEDLRKYGVFQSNTFNAFMPDLPQNLCTHFLRGVFDGDGCIRDKKYPSISIANASKDFLLSIESVLHDSYGFTKRKLYKHSSGSCYNLEYGKQADVRKFYEICYQNNPFCLKRKLQVFQKHYD